MCVVTKDFRGVPHYWNEDLAKWVKDKNEATIYDCAEAVGEISRARKLAYELHAQTEPFDSMGYW